MLREAASIHFGARSPATGGRRYNLARTGAEDEAFRAVQRSPLGGAIGVLPEQFVTHAGAGEVAVHYAGRGLETAAEKRRRMVATGQWRPATPGCA